MNENQYKKLTSRTITITSFVVFAISVMATVLTRTIAPLNEYQDFSIILIFISGFIMFGGLFLRLYYSVRAFEDATVNLEKKHIEINTKFSKLFDSNLEKLNTFSSNFISYLREETIKTISNLPITSQIVQNETKREYVNDIYNKFGKRLVELSNGKVTEDDPELYHKFAIQTFDLVKENGVIIASSNVNPTGFWESPIIAKYLKRNKYLIESKHVTFFRYFFVNKDNEEISKKAIAKNIKIGAKVFVIEKDKYKSSLSVDGGRIDDTICVKSILDKNLEIIKVKAFFKENSEFEELSRIIDLWEDVAKDALTYYKMTQEDFYKLLDD